MGNPNVKTAMTQEQSRKLALLLRGGMLLFWMGIIFFLSSLPGSGNRYDNPPLWYILERKGAHVFEFGILTLLAFRFFRVWFVSRESWQRIAALAVVFASSSGALDELHQAFVFGRGSRLFDVGIDILGSLLALGLIWSIISFGPLKKFQKML